jgi:hypothetical protein
MNAWPIVHNAAALIFGALGVALGWICLHFIGQPIRDFFSLRREIRRLMLLHWDDDTAQDYNLHEETSAREFFGRFAPTRSAFHELAAQISAFHQGEALASWFVKWLGFDLPKASAQLKHISMFFGTYDENREKDFMRLDAALKFRINPSKRIIYNPYNTGR